MTSPNVVDNKGKAGHSNRFISNEENNRKHSPVKNQRTSSPVKGGEKRYVNKEDEVRQSNTRIKSMTEILLFLYRLFNFIG